MSEPKQSAGDNNNNTFQRMAYKVTKALRTSLHPCTVPTRTKEKFKEMTVQRDLDKPLNFAS